MAVGQGLPIKKNDLVAVIAGKDKGKRGKIVKVIPKTTRVLVEKVNMVKRHTKPGHGSKQGGILERENPIHASNLMLVCNHCDRPVRVGVSRLANSRKARVCKKCGEVVD
ncbi:50S ribosomal protein L24 [Candidatus Methylomirabilis lanthanidiphila]|uniref:Large ribosomal subunit protein uL24 n=1 Tax=Candidatus Methylomirabilis lanthanidiphila TaxID=2211376 RepID=A0A564ZIE4_9BACT|nr:50S ribosomal protein L24 [Candidatus Methylomirabilis lanthanidiphila]